ncbi:class I SAM-dependent methyltransferase [Undibacterium sp. Ji49W]|uniref:class I SAM-dependent methyltransferase n=1 Tax=Undibacterium sp. Ji49W TaxID=3413040 RepID=UPI003BF12AF4
MAKVLKNLLVNYIHDRRLLVQAKNFARGRLIDIGCGIKPYQKIFAGHVTEHVGVDHELSVHDKSNMDLLGTAYQIPVEDGSFDTAVCTAVLEHLEEPELALKECFRVLRPGGYAIYSVPFIWHLHEEPRDFYRFTKYGLEHIFKKAGFVIVELEALSGFWVTFGQLFVYNLYRFNRGPLRWFRIVDALGLLVQACAFLLDKLDKTEQWTWMYLVVAQKPENPGAPDDFT